MAIGSHPNFVLRVPLGLAFLVFFSLISARELKVLGFLSNKYLMLDFGIHGWWYLIG